MKKNDMKLSNAEIGIIANKMGAEMTLRMSPMGNPIVKHRNTEGNNVIFAFYKHENGYIIRRRKGYSNPFGSGHVLNGGRPFPNITSAMEYFAKYKEKYPSAIVG